MPRCFMMRSIYMNGSWFLIVSKKFIEILTLVRSIMSNEKKNNKRLYLKKRYISGISLFIYIGDEKNDQLPQFRGGFRPR